LAAVEGIFWIYGVVGRQKGFNAPPWRIGPKGAQDSAKTAPYTILRRL
jgi:hypothetical protein